MAEEKELADFTKKPLLEQMRADIGNAEDTLERTLQDKDPVEATQITLMTFCGLAEPSFHEVTSQSQRKALMNILKSKLQRLSEALPDSPSAPADITTTSHEGFRDRLTGEIKVTYPAGADKPQTFTEALIYSQNPDNGPSGLMKAQYRTAQGIRVYPIKEYGSLEDTWAAIFADHVDNDVKKTKIITKASLQKALEEKDPVKAIRAFIVNNKICHVLLYNNEKERNREWQKEHWVGEIVGGTSVKRLVFGQHVVRGWKLSDKANSLNSSHEISKERVIAGSYSLFTPEWVTNPSLPYQSMYSCTEQLDLSDYMNELYQIIMQPLNAIREAYWASNRLKDTFVKNIDYMNPPTIQHFVQQVSIYYNDFVATQNPTLGERYYLRQVSDAIELALTKIAEYENQLVNPQQRTENSGPTYGFSTNAAEREL